MPKRKADKSITEWLEEGVAASGASQRLIEGHHLQTTQPNLPTAESSRAAKAADGPTESSCPEANPVHVGIAADEATSTGTATRQAEVAADEQLTPQGLLKGWLSAQRKQPNGSGHC